MKENAQVAMTVKKKAITKRGYNGTVQNSYGCFKVAGEKQLQKMR
jgi:hypothetical protein